MTRLPALVFFSVVANRILEICGFDVDVFARMFEDAYDRAERKWRERLGHLTQSRRLVEVEPGLGDMLGASS